MTFNKTLISTAAAMMFSGAAIAQDAPTGSAQAGAQAQGQISTQGGNTQAGASGTASANEQGANGSLRGGVSGTIGSTTAGLSGAMQQRFQQYSSEPLAALAEFFNYFKGRKIAEIIVKR